MQYLHYQVSQIEWLIANQLQALDGHFKFYQLKKITRILSWNAFNTTTFFLGDKIHPKCLPMLNPHKPLDHFI